MCEVKQFQEKIDSGLKAVIPSRGSLLYIKPQAFGKCAAALYCDQSSEP